jgi:N-acetylglucosaminyldiphosphoundecaprenol N-acetyl-beta-D-mannosaminyltransferase
MLKTVKIAGLPIANLSHEETNAFFMAIVEEFKTGNKPHISTSANGEVIAKVHQNPQFMQEMLACDMINADGMPLVWASKILTTTPLPERVATTDLFHVVARDAEIIGKSFYFFGTTQSELDLALINIRALYPRLKIVGSHHGYVKIDESDAVIAQINEAAPDILWIAMGIQLEQAFALMLRERLTTVAVIKTCGGLLNYISGSASRAPSWMQKLSLEWLYRLYLEPKRLGWRYISTNPVALWYLATKTGV